MNGIVLWSAGRCGLTLPAGIQVLVQPAGILAAIADEFFIPDQHKGVFTPGRRGDGRCQYDVDD